MAAPRSTNTVVQAFRLKSAKSKNIGVKVWLGTDTLGYLSSGLNMLSILRVIGFHFRDRVL